MPDDLFKLDPIFAAPPGQTASAPDNKQQESNPLADLDPIFSKPIGPSAEAAKTSSPQPRDYTPEVVGGVAGAVVGTRAPKYENPKLTSARADYAGAQASEGVLRGDLTRMQGSRLDTADNARLVAEDAQAELRMARQELSAAEAAARDLNAIPERLVSPTSAEAALAKGTSEVEGALSQGSLRHSEKMGEIREANQVRKGIAGYRQGLPQGERVPLTGYTQSSRLIVPNELADAPVKSALQIEAENNLKAAQEKHAAAVKRAADAKVQQEAAMKPSRPETSLSSDVTKASSTTAGKKAALNELTKARSFLSKIPGFNTLMGGLSGAELVHAYRQLQEGNTLEGVMAGLSGAGGLIAMAPHPVAKVIGTAMSVPPLAYQGYQAFKGDNAGVPTNVNPMGD